MKHLKNLIDLINSDTPLTCEHLNEIAMGIQDLRDALLFEYEQAGAAPMAESQFLKALSFLELAAREMQQADLYQTRELGNMRRPSS